MLISLKSLNKAAQKRQNVSVHLKPNLRLFLAVALFFWGWMGAYCLTLYHPKYESESVVLIKDSAINARYVEPDQYYERQNTSSSSANPVLNTMGLLKSESISQDLYHYFQSKHPEELKRLRIKNQAQWEAFYANGKNLIKAKNEPGTDLISIRFIWKDPIIAKEALEVILESFRQASLNINRAEQEGRSMYLEGQVAQIEKQLTDLRTKKSQYKEEMSIANLSQESGTLATTGIELANQLSQTEAGAKGKEQEYLRYEKMLELSPEKAMVASALGMNTTLSKLQDQLYELSQKYSELKTTLTDKNPKVKEVKSQIEQVKADIRTEMNRTLGAGKGNNVVAVADTTRGTIINQMVAARAESIRLYTEAETLRKRMDEVDQKIKTLPNLEEQLSSMEDQEKSLSDALSTLRQRQLEAHMKQAETLSNVFIVDPPRIPLKPQFPTQVHLLVLGFIMGIVAGVLAVLIKLRLAALREEASPWLMKELFELDVPQGNPTDNSASGGNAPQPVPVTMSNQPVDEFLTEVFGKQPDGPLNNEHQERVLRLKQRLYKGLLNSSPSTKKQNVTYNRPLRSFNFSNN